MLLTFTRKAALSMRERAEEVTVCDLSELRCGTFHAVAAQLLREAGREFTIINETEATSLVTQLQRELLFEREIDGAEALEGERVLAYFMQAREEDLDLEELLEGAASRFSSLRSLLVDLQARYQVHKAKQSLLDYADTLWELRALLRRQGGSVRAGLRAVLVDEVQDLNRMQREIVSLLTAEGAWRIEVGDAQQSIYGFRGAAYDAILERASAPEVNVQKLTTNYRSVAEIVALARDLGGAAGLKLRAARPFSGSNPILLGPADPQAEAEAVLAWVRNHYEEGVPLSDLAVLARTHEHLRETEAALTGSGYQVSTLGRRGGVFEQARAYVLAFMRLAETPNDLRIWQQLLPLLGADPEEEEVHLALLVASVQPLALAATLTDDLACQQLLAELAGGHANYWLWEQVSRQLLGGVFTEVDLAKLILIGDHDGEGTSYLTELVAASEEARDLEAGVRVGTIHAAKGLEWPHVMVVRCSYGAFPSARSVAEDNLAEERRLFYVAITRAAESLVVCEAGWIGTNKEDFLANTRIRLHFCESKG
jgi:DNA helicase-2/ATP-dependent DNA helicase PcrA